MTARRLAAPRETTLAAATLIALAAQLVGVVPALATSLPSGCSRVTSTVTCAYASGDNEFVVPASVTTIDVVAIGGAGAGLSGATGGAGARVTASLDVTPGATLHAVVGGNGTGSAGGANGGGAPGGGATCGGGGGASDVRTSADLADRILVAGGGGGGGCQGRVANDPATPGGNGGDAGTSGADSQTFLDVTNYGGLGGAAGCSPTPDATCGLGGNGDPAGADGVLGGGGAGALLGSGGPGGGGGGGLFGGGAGGTGSISQTCTFLGCVRWITGGGGGGGGGSNLVPIGGSASTDSTGIPLITISYTAPALPLHGNGKLAFSSNRDGNNEIYLMSPDGTGQVDATFHAGHDDGPAWSPDGTKIAFESNRADGNYDIYVMNADGTNQTRLTYEASDTSLALLPTWSPDGTKIAFELLCGFPCTDAVMVTNADGSTLPTRLTPNVAGDFVGEPAWSPDGTKIAYSAQPGFDIDIFVMDADGSNPTDLGVAGELPDWSPDGTKIAYTTGGQLSIMDADGSNVTSLSTAGSYPAWSPDGTKIAFNVSGDVWLMDANGANKLQLTTDPHGDSQPAWRPVVGSGGGGGGGTWSLASGVDAASVAEGSRAGFTVTLDNQTAGALTTVAISASLTGGPGIDWSLAADSGSGWSITGTAPNQILTFPAGTLAAGSTTTAHVTSVTGGNSCGTYDLDATLTSDQGGAQTSASLDVTGCFTSVGGSVTPDAATVPAGSQAGFIVKLDNTGTIDFDSIDLTDVLPAGSGVSWSLANDSDPGWSITGSAPNQSLTYIPDVLAVGTSTTAHVVSGTSQASCGTYQHNIDVIATGGGGQSEATPTGSLDVVDCHPAPIAEITGDTTCAAFAGGSAVALSGIDYKVRNGSIALLNTAPGRLFYWVQAAGVAGTNQLTVTESITTGNFAKRFALAKGSAIYDGSCTAQKATFSQAADGSVTVRWQARTAGPFVVKLSYAPKSVVGQPAPNPSTVTYAFATTGIAGSAASIDLHRR